MEDPYFCWLGDRRLRRAVAKEYVVIAMLEADIGNICIETEKCQERMG
jgi:hypothetical protein